MTDSLHFELLRDERDARWQDVRAFAAVCSWRAGAALAREMENDTFTAWERVIAAFDGNRLAGFCTVAQTDCIADLPYTPYIGYVFVNEAYRGHRLSAKMIDFAAAYLKTCGFDCVYLISDHENLYEKYGFTVVDRQIAPWGALEKIYMRTL